MAGKKRNVEWNGIRYPSLKEAAQACGISEFAMRYRLTKGWVSDNDIPERGAAQMKKIVWNGVEYESIRKAAEACKVSYIAMAKRIERGYTCDDDLNHKVAKTGFAPHSHCAHCGKELTLGQQKYCDTKCKGKAAYHRWKSNNPNAYNRHKENMREAQRNRRNSK